MQCIKTVTVKKSNTMKVKDVRRQKSDDRRWEEERDVMYEEKRRQCMSDSKALKNVCTINIKMNI